MISSFFSALAPFATHAKNGIRFLAHHTGLPALVVASLLVVVGYRILKRTARFAVEVVLVAGLLMVATQLGWIRW
jgi:hypothetical protein